MIGFKQVIPLILLIWLGLSLNEVHSFVSYGYGRQSVKKSLRSAEVQHGMDVGDVVESEEFLANVFLTLSPLEGGPQFLPLHSAIVLESANDERIRLDFLPQNPTDQSVLKELISLGNVPGLVRFQKKQWNGIKNEQKRISKFQVRLMKEQKLVNLSSIQEFCQKYQEERGQLNLVTNNCFHFCAALSNKIHLMN